MIKKIFDEFNKTRVLVIGDVMIDKYHFGSVDRISPEAPVPILKSSHKEVRLGGAANVALNLKHLGATVNLLSVIGRDDACEDLKNLIHKNNITWNIIVDKNRKTTVKNRFLSGSHHLLRVDEEVDGQINEENTEYLIDIFKRYVLDTKATDVVIFEDYDKGVLHKDMIRELVDICNRKDIPTLVDPKKRNFHYYNNTTLFKPNLKELKEGLKLTNDNLNQAFEVLQKELCIKGCLVTLSENGVYINYNGIEKTIDAHKREICDVSGAGDTVSAVAALCLAQNLDPETLAEYSNLAGGLVCQYSGVVPINKKEFYNELVRIYEK